MAKQKSSGGLFARLLSWAGLRNGSTDRSGAHQSSSQSNEQAPTRASGPTAPRDAEKVPARQSRAMSRKKEPVRVDAVVGLDFGTSATKVIVRTPYLPGESAVSLPVKPSLRAERSSHLWESAVWYDGRSGAFSERRSKSASKLTGIKAVFMHDPESTLTGEVRALDACVAYLAIVLRTTIAWFSDLRTNQGLDLEWSVNLGLPAATYDTPILEPYRRALAAAWGLAGRDANLSLENVREAIENVATQPTTHLQVIPEVAAAVAGFARSENRRDGLYVLADVGAATLDACCFRLSQPAAGLNRYSMLVADVQPLGVAACESLREQGKTDGEIGLAIEKVMWGVIWNTKLHRDPNAAEWKENLPLFLCGGGANNDLHRRSMEKLSPWLAKNAGGSIQVLAIDEPDSLSSDGDTELGRLAVAAGLSYPEIDIGELVRPSEIKDIPRPTYRDISQQFVSKDQV